MFVGYKIDQNRVTCWGEEQYLHGDVEEEALYLHGDV